MRETESNRLLVRLSPVQSSSVAIRRALKLATVALGVGMVLSAGVARAQDGDDDDQPFEQRVIKQIMSGLGGTNMDNTGIDYRERSPLVVPPKIDLPPPDTSASTANVPNWPLDPDVQRRRASAAAGKTVSTEDAITASRSLTPAEMASKKVRKSASSSDTVTPGDPNKNIVLSPAQLGVSSGMFKNMFGGGNKGETAEFKGEPTREELTQPPPGYQTPSSSYAYGTGPKEVMRNASELNPMTGKY